jgi:molecular chaperone GrpE
MSERNSSDHDPAPGDIGEEAAAQREAVGVGSTVAELVAALDAARAETEQSRDRALRAHAEVDNMRRRAQRDVENAHKFALERFANELLPVVDSLEHAVEAARAGGGDGATSAIADGVALSLKLFLDTLARADLVQLDPVGEPFSPKLHQAVSMVESASAEPGSILQVLQKGYTLNGRLVRPAMVIVAKVAAGNPIG